MSEAFERDDDYGLHEIDWDRATILFEQSTQPHQDAADAVAITAEAIGVSAGDYFGLADGSTYVVTEAGDPVTLTQCVLGPGEYHLPQSFVRTISVQRRSLTPKELALSTTRRSWFVSGYGVSVSRDNYDGDGHYTATVHVYPKVSQATLNRLEELTNEHRLLRARVYYYTTGIETRLVRADQDLDW